MCNLLSSRCARYPGNQQWREEEISSRGRVLVGERVVVVDPERDQPGEPRRWNIEVWLFLTVGELSAPIQSLGQCYLPSLSRSQLSVLRSITFLSTHPLSSRRPPPNAYPTHHQLSWLNTLSSTGPGLALSIFPQREVSRPTQLPTLARPCPRTPNSTHPPWTSYPQATSSPTSISPPSAPQSTTLVLFFPPCFSFLIDPVSSGFLCQHQRPHASFHKETFTPELPIFHRKGSCRHPRLSRNGLFSSEGVGRV